MRMRGNTLVRILMVVCGVLLLNVEVEGTCAVDNVQVVQNFDVQRFMGRWYEISWVPYYFEPPFDNYRDFQENYHQYNATHIRAINAGRVSSTDPTCNEGQAFYELESSGKWKTTKSYDIDYEVDYWVIDTDYYNYAFVWGCDVMHDDGTCDKYHAWKWSRAQTISEEHEDLLNSAMNRVCANAEDFMVSYQETDCDPSNECIVDLIQVQKDFDVNRFQGKWYEISWIPYYFERHYNNYLDFQEDYYRSDSNHMIGLNAGRGARNDPQCIHGTHNYEITGHAARWRVVKNIDGNDIYFDYWILDTDYDNYAVVYGCDIRDDDGICTEVHGWKWSRTSIISAEHDVLANMAIAKACMDLTMFIPSLQEQDCGVENPCKVSNIQTQAGFNLNRYLGRWYELSWVAYYFEPPFDNYLDFQESYMKVNNTHIQGDNAGRIAATDPTCVWGEHMYHVTETPGRWTGVKRRDGIDYNVDYWVIKTDYDNYAFVYGCDEEYPSGLCKDSHGWKWSREQTLEPVFEQVLDQAVASVCMLLDDFDISAQNNDCSAASDVVVPSLVALVTLTMTYLRLSDSSLHV